jgi:emp24/gp25L/p24 family/GOLD
MTFDGPLPEPDGTSIDSGATLQRSLRLVELGSNLVDHYMHFSETIDFEHLNLGALVDDDEVNGNPKMGIESEEEEEETEEQRNHRRQGQRRKALESRQRQERRKVQQRQKVRHEGEPFQFTFAAPGKGWYRYCIKATWNQVTAEVDMRKESEMGGLSDDGSVRTVSQKLEREEEVLLEEDTAAKEGIKDEDFESTRNKLKELRHLLADIQSKQSQERHRLALHSVTNEHSHSRMVLGSLMETVLFIAVTSYQVYTIRKWFKGAPVLAR